MPHLTTHILVGAKCERAKAHLGFEATIKMRAPTKPSSAMSTAPQIAEYTFLGIILHMAEQVDLMLLLGASTNQMCHGCKYQSNVWALLHGGQRRWKLYAILLTSTFDSAPEGEVGRAPCEPRRIA